MPYLHKRGVHVPLHDYQTIRVKHNAEMAHRLFQSAGKCQAIHGHSWKIELALTGPVDHTGKVAGLDFGAVKWHFRAHIDRTYDHRVLLYEGDPFAHGITLSEDTTGRETELPGLKRFEVDPTTENVARIIGEWACGMFKGKDIVRVECSVWETDTNNSTWVWQNEMVLDSGMGGLAP
jgi:6-pyruvoyl-tetrahydropterin synthase